MADAAPEKHEFGAEVGRLLHLVVHSLYSDREIFLRELVANAADATERRRFEALTDSALTPPADARIRIAPDKDARTVTVSDDGIGMDRQAMIDNLGTIARSGTRAFGEALAAARPEDRPSLIGQFGVGFYSAFMVADRVEVVSRKAGTDEAFAWTSDGQGQYAIAPAERATVGTDVVLHLKDDAAEFLEPMRLESIVRKWADHVAQRIVLVRDGKEEAANEGAALWRKPRAEVSEQDYAAFYRHLGYFFDNPWATLHWRAEGTQEYYGLLFVPGMKPFDPVEGERESRVRLHVRRMFITDKAAILPPWLRFVQGVVDTEDLPLNVSREMLQTTPVLARIRKAAMGRVLAELKAKSADAAEYAKFWENFGPYLKEGVWEDHESRAEIAGLLRFRTTADDGWTSLAEYVARMKPGQEAIHYLAGDSIEALRASPHLEGFRAKGIEVLLMADPIDAFWPERLDAFEEKKLRSASQAGVDAADDAALPDISVLLAAMKAALGDAVGDVRATSRLRESAAALAAEAQGPDLQMQRLLRRAGRAGGGAKPVLEVNPSHALIVALAAKADDAQAVAEASATLLDLALVRDGEAPADPAAFARRVEAMMGARVGA